MARLLSVVVMAAVVLIAGSALVSTAFTTSEVQRNADFSVEADGNAVIQIEPGSAAGTSTNSEGKLQIRLTNLNKDSQFVFGDTADPSATHVFRFTNNDGTSHTFNVGVNNLGGTADFYIDEPNNASIQSFTTPGTSSSFTLNDGQTAYVAVEVTDSGKNNATGSVYINATGPGAASP